MTDQLDLCFVNGERGRPGIRTIVKAGHPIVERRLGLRLQRRKTGIVNWAGARSIDVCPYSNA
jgi:hypothetical protein